MFDFITPNLFKFRGFSQHFLHLIILIYFLIYLILTVKTKNFDASITYILKFKIFLSTYLFIVLNILDPNIMENILCKEFKIILKVKTPVVISNKNSKQILA